MITLRELTESVELDADIADIDVWSEEQEDYIDSIGFCDYVCFADCVYGSEELLPYMDYMVKNISCGAYDNRSHVHIEIAKIKSVKIDVSAYKSYLADTLNGGLGSVDEDNIKAEAELIRYGSHYCVIQFHSRKSFDFKYSIPKEYIIEWRDYNGN